MTVTSYDLNKRKMSYKRSDGFIGFCTMMKNETVKCSGSSSDTKATYRANEDGLVSSNEVRSSVRTKLINQKKSDAQPSLKKMLQSKIEIGKINFLLIDERNLLNKKVKYFF